MYLNEIEPYPAQWLRNLISTGEIPSGNVDERDIKNVTGRDIVGYQQCHFFAGIGGWPLALKLAGWPTDAPVWTGSCPCQPFSQAGKHKAEADSRHLWPEFRRLIAECHPPIIFGEQVTSPAGRKWLSGVRADLEALGYAVGAADLCAAGVAAPHIRQRLFWVADLDREGRSDCSRWPRSEKKAPQRIKPTEFILSDGNPWPRPIPRPDASWLVDGFSASSHAVRALGNAIVPQIAAVFVRAYMLVCNLGNSYYPQERIV